MSEIKDDLYMPSKEELEEISPQSYNFELAEEKGLLKGETFSKKYLRMQSLYKKALEQYLMKKIDIKKYDDELANSKLHFIPGDKDKRCFYQVYDYMGLTFFYLRNNIHIEKLDSDDLELLKKSEENYDYAISEDLIKMVERTYKNIIMVSFEGDDEFNKYYNAIYGNTINGERIIPNTALVLELNAQPEFDKKGNFVDWPKEKTKNDYIDDLILRLEQEYTDKLGIPVEVLQY
ncbi:hypothetical protein [Anaeromicropila herbilytica]|nr:hypothetical protein [Anaeromicropila herbilytica]